MSKPNEEQDSMDKLVAQTTEEDTVTVRDRDTLEQIRIDKSRCSEYLADKLRPME